MAIRDILVSLDSSSAGEGRLRLALGLARTHKAHLVAAYAMTNGGGGATPIGFGPVGSEAVGSDKSWSARRSGASPSSGAAVECVLAGLYSGGGRPRRYKTVGRGRSLLCVHPNAQLQKLRPRYGQIVRG